MKLCSRLIGGMILAGAFLSAGPGFAQDFTWNFNTPGTVDYQLTAVSDPQVFSGSLPAFDPTLTLRIGKRYQVSVVNSGSHPLQLIAKGPTDIVALSQGSIIVGSLESDPGVAWTDNLAGTVQFTMTQKLLDAMKTGGRTPGYRCNIHTSFMRGDFNIVSDPSDGQWTFDVNGMTDFKLTAVSSAQIFAGALPANDPTLTLIIGRRYRVTNLDPVSHPLELVGLGGTSAGDSVLLAQGSAVQGSLEDDPGVAWFDNGSGIVDFTVTQALVDAMNASGLTPGYRCDDHPDAMRGAFILLPAPNAVRNGGLYD